MPNNPVLIRSCPCGQNSPLLLIAGPCVLQKESAFRIAEGLVQIIEALRLSGEKINLVFKGSFDKANRSSGSTWRGLGLEEGLRLLESVKREFDLPCTTDIHEPDQAEPVGEICDLLQIPAFLSRQTDLLIAAAKTGRSVHVKKGQFLSPYDMKNVIDKLESAGCSNILLGERGTFFGYGRLVNDFRSLVIMRGFGTPVVYDATHSVQEPGGCGTSSGGHREFVPYLAQAAAATGIDALFLETHYNPDESPSDGPNMIPLDQINDLLKKILSIRKIVEPS